MSLGCRILVTGSSRPASLSKSSSAAVTPSCSLGWAMIVRGGSTYLAQRTSSNEISETFPGIATLCSLSTLSAPAIISLLATKMAVGGLGSSSRRCVAA